MKTRPALSLGIMRQLYEDVSLYPGALKKTPAACEDLPATFFRSVEKRASTRSLGHVDDVLDHHNFEASAFLRRTHLLQYGVVAPLLKDAETIRRRRSQSRRHWVIQEARRVARLQGNSTIDVASLDRMREDDPVASGNAASVALRKSQGSRVAAQGLGCWASAQRVSYRLDLAVMAIAEAILIAARDGHDDVLANLIERSVYITMDRGHYEWALQLALEAHAQQARLFDLEKMGETMVTIAVVLYHLSKNEEALRIATGARSLLDPESSYRAAVYSVIGSAHANLGDLSAAEKAAREFSRIATGRRVRGRAAWLQAIISTERQSLDLAQAHYLTALELTTEAADALLIGAEFVQVLIKCGKPEDAIAVTKSHLLRLYQPLRDDPLDEKRLLFAAHAELVRAAFGAKLSLELAMSIAERIKQGRSHRSARLRRQVDFS